MNSILLSLLGFSVAMYVTPGPNNVMVAASAASLRRTRDRATYVRHRRRLCLHADAGLRGPRLRLTRLPVAAADCSAGSAPRGCRGSPGRSPPPQPPGEGGRGRVLGFIGAVAFQWINPKAWLIAVGAAGEYSVTEPIHRHSARAHLPDLPRRRHAVPDGVGTAGQRRRPAAALAGTVARVQRRDGRAACPLGPPGVD